MFSKTHTHTSAELKFGDKTGIKTSWTTLQSKARYQNKINLLIFKSLSHYFYSCSSERVGWWAQLPSPAVDDETMLDNGAVPKHIASKTKTSRKMHLLFPCVKFNHKISCSLNVLKPSNKKTKEKAKKYVCFLCLSITIQVCYLFFCPEMKPNIAWPPPTESFMCQPNQSYLLMLKSAVQEMRSMSF